MGAPPSSPTDEEIAQFMREATAEEILTSYGGPFRALTDGTVIPAEGNDLFATGNYANKVPIIVGTNKDEYKLWTNPLFVNIVPGVSDEVRDGVARYVSDIWRLVAADQFATDITATADQPDVYVYRFNWGSPDENGNSPLPGTFGNSLGACHTMEITFMLGNWEEWVYPRATPLLFNAGNAAGRENMSTAIMEYFAAFAHSGNPNGGNLAAWEPFTSSGSFKVIEIDVDLDDSSAKLTVDTEVYTEESVRADLNAHLEEPTRSEVRATMRALGWVR